MVPLPMSINTLPERDYPPGSHVLGLYPDTSCFYKAIVRGGGPNMEQALKGNPAKVSTETIITYQSGSCGEDMAKGRSIADLLCIVSNFETPFSFSCAAGKKRTWASAFQLSASFRGRWQWDPISSSLFSRGETRRWFLEWIITLLSFLSCFVSRSFHFFFLVHDCTIYRSLEIISALSKYFEPDILRCLSIFSKHGSREGGTLRSPDFAWKREKFSSIFFLLT